MKKEKLAQISKGIYYVVNRSTFKKSVGMICDFYISDIIIYEKVGKKVSFEITLKNTEITTNKKSKEKAKKREKTLAFPITYLRDPLSWFLYGFDTDEFHIVASKKEFEASMIQIVDIILKYNETKKEKVKEEYIGWNSDNLNNNELFKAVPHYFGKFEEPGVSVGLEENKVQPCNVVFEYLKLADMSVSAPLMSYMLLSLLIGLEIFGTNARPDFNMAIVGGNETLRRNFALFFTNLYKRDPLFIKNEYKTFHINKKDTATDMRFKSAAVNDCVLIAFEPDKKHLNILLKEMYRTNTVEEEMPVKNLLLFTGERFDSASIENTLVVKLNDTHNMNAIEDRFRVIKGVFDVDSIALEDDRLMESIYYHIKRLIEKLLKNRSYVRIKFVEHNKSFRECVSDITASEKAIDVAQNLSFAFWLYSKSFGAQDDAFCNEVYDAILKSAINSFPTEGQATEDEVERVIFACRQVDTYFESKNGKKMVGRIGFENNPNDKRVWWDDEMIYIKQHNVNEFLKIIGSNLRYNNKSGKALASIGLIKTYEKSDGKKEYSVHIQKPLRAKPEQIETKSEFDDSVESNTKSKIKKKTKKDPSRMTSDRFVGFMRDNCREYNLFVNIEQAIEERIKKDQEEETKEKVKELSRRLKKYAKASKRESQ